MTPQHYVELIEACLQPLADPTRAAAMRAYLRDRYPFLGIAAPVRRHAVKSLPRPAADGAALLDIARLLWNKPEREYRYTAVDLLARHAKLLEVADLPALQALALREPWWETVDSLSGVISSILHEARRKGEDGQPLMDDWLAHPVFWIRRIAMLHQLGWRLDSDAARLFTYAATLAPEAEFFIRKAIGWALRDYARWNPAAVGEFVRNNRATLSALTIREATKHLPLP